MWRATERRSGRWLLTGVRSIESNWVLCNNSAQAATISCSSPGIRGISGELAVLGRWRGRNGISEEKGHSGRVGPREEHPLESTARRSRDFHPDPLEGPDFSDVPNWRWPIRAAGTGF